MRHLSLGDVIDALSRFRPFLGTLIAILLIVVLLPREQRVPVSTTGARAFASETTEPAPPDEAPAEVPVESFTNLEDPGLGAEQFRATYSEEEEPGQPSPSPSPRPTSSPSPSPSPGPSPSPSPSPVFCIPSVGCFNR